MECNSFNRGVKFITADDDNDCHASVNLVYDSKARRRFFAARCYASAAYAVMRCLSVCLSRSYSTFCQTNKHNLQNFFTVVEPRHSSFPYQTSCHGSISTRIPPPNGGVECRWGRQHRDLSQYLAPSHAVNASIAKCNTLSSERPWLC